MIRVTVCLASMGDSLLTHDSQACVALLHDISYQRSTGYEH